MACRLVGAYYNSVQLYVYLCEAHFEGRYERILAIVNLFCETKDIFVFSEMAQVDIFLCERQGTILHNNCHWLEYFFQVLTISLTKFPLNLIPRSVDWQYINFTLVCPTSDGIMSTPSIWNKNIHILYNYKVWLWGQFFLLFWCSMAYNCHWAGNIFRLHCICSQVYRL